jgi:predicted kinase
MPAIIIVSGCPGSGKTTLAGALARLRPKGLHLLTDVFYRFPVTLIDPTLPESHGQNSVIIRAFGRAARAFAEGGYHVVLDGVVGPWFLPILREELAGPWSVSYVILELPEPEALQRVRARQGSGASAQVRHMAAAFAALPSFQAHVIPTAGASPDQVLRVAEQGLSEGRFLLSW